MEGPAHSTVDTGGRAAVVRRVQPRILLALFDQVEGQLLANLFDHLDRILGLPPRSELHDERGRLDGGADALH